jgi:hypothetical protein
MKHFLTSCTILIASIATSALAVPPRQLVTHNTTNVESRAYVGGTIQSRYPARAQADSKVPWSEVRVACFGHTINGQCQALVRMQTSSDNGETPVDLGMVSIDLNTGIILPSSLTANGYTLTVNGPGETTLTKN